MAEPSRRVSAEGSASRAPMPTILSEGVLPSVNSLEDAGETPPMAVNTPKPPAPTIISKGSSFESACSAIFAYRYQRADEPSAAAAAPPPPAGTAPHISGSGTAATAPDNATQQAVEEPAWSAAKALERTDKAYDLAIGAASLLGGFSIRDVVAAPGLDTFDGHSLAFYLYRPLIAAAVLLDLYAVMGLVLNRYLAARAYKDVGPRAFETFHSATTESRKAAMWAFLTSLPIFLIAAALKQVLLVPLHLLLLHHHHDYRRRHQHSLLPCS